MILSDEEIKAMKINAEHKKYLQISTSGTIDKVIEDVLALVDTIEKLQKEHDILWDRIEKMKQDGYIKNA